MRSLSRVVIGLVLVCLLAIAGGWIVRLVGESRLQAARERFEASTGSLSLAAYVRPDLEDDKNAAVWLRAGAEVAEIHENGFEVMAEIRDQEIGSWSAETHAAAVALIESNQEVFEKLERCVGLEDSTFDFPYEEGFSAVNPPMMDLFRSGRLVAMDLRMALATEEPQRVSRDLQILGQLSRALARESFLISAILHLGVERLYLGAIGDILETGIGDRELLVDLKNELGQQDGGDALRRSIAGEAAAVVNVTGLRGSEADATGRWDQLLFWLLEPYQLAALLDTYAGIVRSLEEPWIATLESRREEPGRPVWGPHQLMATNLLDAVERVKATEMSRALATKALELELGRLEIGELPQSFDSGIVDQYASGSVLYERVADGGAVLSAPEAVELWLSEHAGAEEHRKPLFVWSLSGPGVS
jgi:hypothetical protein